MTKPTSVEDLKSQEAGSPVTHEHSRSRAELHPGPAASIRIRYTDEDAQIICRQPLAYSAITFESDRYDAGLMLRLTQWRGSCLQYTTPVAKQIACWDFMGRRT